MNTYYSRTPREDYAPPFLGNGDIAFALDCEGGMSYSTDEYESRHFKIGYPAVFRAGRRLAKGHRNAELCPMGSFVFREGAGLVEFSQSLDVKKGRVYSECHYADGETIVSDAFLHREKNLYLLKKEFAVGGEYSFEVNMLPSPLEEFADYGNFTQSVEDGVLYMDFRYVGQKIYRGRVAFFLDREFEVSGEGCRATLTFKVNAGEKVCFCYCIEDDLFCEDCTAEVSSLVSEVRSRGFDALASDTEKSLAEYYSLGYVKTEDETLNRIYNTCLYGLSCFATKHFSIPIGICNYWHGKFFAFDEYYSFLGLLGANRLGMAKKVTDFRREVCLKKAISRQTKRTDTPAARFDFLTGEYGDDMCSSGFWVDHIFHMALVALGAFEYYEFSGDKEFLEQSYEMIRACAKYYTVHMLYRDGDRYYIGKCTDLERLGSSKENAFMTTCGVIKNLEVLVRAADILGVDREYRDECEFVAKKLRESLPVKEDRYIPAPGCKQKSVAVFAAKFPYDVLENDDEKMLAAWSDFEEKGSAYGNMYAMGKRLSPWYACWKAEGYARIRDCERAYAALKRSYESVGAFSEMFEINEEGTRFRPWFTTAEGIFLSTVNEMLLQSDENNVYLLPAFPEASELSFKLAAKGGRVVELNIENGEIAYLSVTDRKGENDTAASVWYKGKKIR